jgi:RNA polymerase sigma-70 factor (ECF subfamily)
MRTALAALVRHGPADDSPPPGEDHVALVTALGAIPEAQRRAVVLYHLVGLSVEDVARETGAPLGTVKARLSRGRTALASLLGQPDDPRSEEVRRVR